MPKKNTAFFNNNNNNATSENPSQQTVRVIKPTVKEITDPNFKKGWFGRVSSINATPTEFFNAFIKFETFEDFFDKLKLFLDPKDIEKIKNNTAVLEELKLFFRNQEAILKEGMQYGASGPGEKMPSIFKITKLDKEKLIIEIELELDQPDGAFSNAKFTFQVGQDAQGTFLEATMLCDPKFNIDATAPHIVKRALKLAAEKFTNPRKFDIKKRILFEPTQVQGYRHAFKKDANPSDYRPEFPSLVIPFPLSKVKEKIIDFKTCHKNLNDKFTYEGTETRGGETIYKIHFNLDDVGLPKNDTLNINPSTTFDVKVENNTISFEASGGADVLGNWGFSITLIENSRKETIPEYTIFYNFGTLGTAVNFFGKIGSYFSNSIKDIEDVTRVTLQDMMKTIFHYIYDAVDPPKIALQTTVINTKEEENETNTERAKIK